LLPILDALLGVDEGYLATIGLIGCEEGRPTPVLVDGGEFIGQVVDVCETAIKSKSSCWRE
jgi:hypothetical protein